MANKNINKVVYAGKTLIDLSSDTVDPSHVLTGKTFHDKSGAVLSGSCTYDSDTSSATAAEAEVLKGKTAYARGAKITGTMPNNGAASGTISTKAGRYVIPLGFHDGSGGVTISPAEQEKIIAENIREGISILGVEGSMSGTEGAKPQAKSVTPKSTPQTVRPDAEQGYNYLSEVTVNAIPYVLSDNPAGGQTATIG